VIRQVIFEWVFAVSTAIIIVIIIIIIVVFISFRHHQKNLPFHVFFR